MRKDRIFPPPEKFREKANLKSLDEYKAIYWQLTGIEAMNCPMADFRLEISVELNQIFFYLIYG